jgi:antitoxin HicB
MRYTVLLEREDDGGYVVSVPALPGCISQGDTRDEALANIREAIGLYIEDCRAAGDPVPTEADKEFTEVDCQPVCRGAMFAKLWRRLASFSGARLAATWSFAGTILMRARWFRTTSRFVKGRFGASSPMPALRSKSSAS